MIVVHKPVTTLQIGDTGTCSVNKARHKADQDLRVKFGLPPYDDFATLVGFERLTFKVKPNAERDPWVYIYRPDKTRSTWNCNPAYFEAHFTIGKGIKRR